MRYCLHLIVIIYVITCGVLLASGQRQLAAQLFALAREYADNSAREVVMFSSVMRAQLSWHGLSVHRWPLCWR